MWHQLPAFFSPSRGIFPTTSLVHVLQDMIEEDGELTDEETVEPEYQGRLESVTSSAKDEEKHDPRIPPLNARDSANWQSLTQLRHWLNELERDASLTVDLADTAAIRDMANTVQGIMDHIRMKIMDVVGIQDVSVSDVMKHKAAELIEDMDRVARQCEKRRSTLMQMAEHSRLWNVARDAVELWMQNADSVIGMRVFVPLKGGIISHGR
ncbi:hypothetical protein ANCCAN_14859 [Ancylostoma caninum]|uniref:Dystrophin-1-like spectrin repeat domain-containing protein n=1 Tax=Ancylostoma caninum TaxID=29170 RepID=A0A368G456_ANCCA|nr:hypothetical protein ANCCAN_14859 [Ancylostoma caninum]